MPGGLAALASSVIMNVVPAQVAGVRSIAVASPPQVDFDGLPHPNILALCHLLGVEEVYAVGGAQAVAMFAYGVEDLCPEGGPGHRSRATSTWWRPSGCSRAGSTSTPRPAPTEIAVLADAAAEPVHVAADLISQAEHDPAAAAVLVTDSPELADAVQAELAAQVPEAKHAERITDRPGRAPVRASSWSTTWPRGSTWSTPTPPSTWSCTRPTPRRSPAQITNAGAIFVGTWSPVSLGDYCAGSTHVLPDRPAAPATPRVST